MNRQHSVLAAALVTTLLLPIQPANATTLPVDPVVHIALMQQIAEIEWNLKSSSLASKLDRSVVDNSISALSTARNELASGNWRTASGLIERAALPLHEMSPEAMAGKHPDTRQWLNERRETLASLTDGSESIAREKKVPTDFVDMARNAITRSIILESQGKPEKAMEIIDQAYVAVQQKVAALRDGQTFYLAIPDLPADRKWSDGLDRFDDRKHLTEQLIREALADGIDASPLLSAMQKAKNSRLYATQMAEAQRWDLAIQSLELAYLTFEDSWRQVGLDW